MDHVQTLSTRDVADILARIGFEAPSAEAIKAITSVCRNEFIADLSSCASGSDSAGDSRARLEGIIGCVAPNTIAAVTSLGLNLSLEDMVSVARKIPVRFLSAVATATNRGNPRHKEAQSYLEQLVKNRPWAVPVVPVAPSELPTQADMQFHAEPQNGAQEAPTAEKQGDVTAQQTSSGRGNNDRSVTVYGFGHELHFTAVNDEGSMPRVIVELVINSKMTDHANKVRRIVLNEQEMIYALAVFRKWHHSAEIHIQTHGQPGDIFTLERKKESFYCNISTRRKEGADSLRPIRILAADAHKVARLFLEQILLAHPSCSTTEVIEYARTINSGAEIGLEQRVA